MAERFLDIRDHLIILKSRDIRHLLDKVMYLRENSRRYISKGGLHIGQIVEEKDNEAASIIERGDLLWTKKKVKDVGFDHYPHATVFRGGQLVKYVQQWRSLGAPDTLINILKIPFREKPPLVPFTDQIISQFSTKINPHLKRELDAMIKQDILRKTKVGSGFLSSMFAIPKPDGLCRPILNLKRLNTFTIVKKFRLLSHYTVPNFLQKDDFLIKIDLSQAYFHIPIKEKHQRFLATKAKFTL